MSCGVGCRRGSDTALLWLWYRLQTVALIQPLAWEPPYAAGEALKRKKKKGFELDFANKDLNPRSARYISQNGSQIYHLHYKIISTVVSLFTFFFF